MSDDPPFDLTGALPFEDGADEPTPQKPGAGVLSAQFAYIGRGLTLPEFRPYVQGYGFGTMPPDYIVLHHTAIPSASWARYPSGAVWDANEAGLSEAGIYNKRKGQLDKLMVYYRDAKGWPAGPHLLIDERWIWLMTPMYDVGVHAAQGNSYRDSSRRLHYSIGIEIVGYYEHVHWSPAVAANVAGAVASLKQRLRTFDYIDKPWAGGIGTHRMYNKPQCPGAAIVPSYYMPILKAADSGAPPPPDDHAGQTHYRVKQAATGGATIRAFPRQSAAMLGRLHAGDDFWGEEVKASSSTFVAGFGSSNIWIRDATMRCVWSGLLEKVTP